MSTRSENDDVVLELNDFDEMFNAPDANPFSTREVEILGEAGIDHLQKRIAQHWPWRRFTRLTLRLPPDQIAPDSAEQTRVAIQRYCEAQIDKNRIQRRRAIQIGLRQLVIALPILLLDVAVLYWLVNAAASEQIGFLGGVLAVLALFAGSLAIWDAGESLAFNWVPFVLDDASYRTIRAMEVVVEPDNDLELQPFRRFSS
jgi:hypothetical protein